MSLITYLPNSFKVTTKDADVLYAAYVTEVLDRNDYLVDSYVTSNV